MPARAKNSLLPYSSRLVSLRRLRCEASLSHILVSDPVDVRYISGFSSSNAVLLVSQRKNVLLTDFRYETDAKHFCRKNPQWSTMLVKADTSMAEAIASQMKPGNSIGFQSEHLTVDEFNSLRKRARNVRFITCGRQINEFLQVKKPSEITSMKRAAEIGDTAFSQLLPEIKPGVSELFLARRLERICSDLGSERPAFETIVLFGARSALPHGKPGTGRLKKGSLVLIDFGCTVNGFASDMTRTMVAGKASPLQKKIYRIVLDAQRNACRHVQAGISAASLDAFARDPITESGYGKMFGHALGHGVGRRIHEGPRISYRVKQKLKENSVITIEPGIYLPGRGGVRIEDMVVVKKRGGRLLTHSPRELMQL